jgi:hypothetical protein
MPELLLHRSCKTLLLEPFIQAQSNNDLSGLVISGEPTPEDIQAAWEEILADYGCYVKSEDTDYTLGLSRQICLLQEDIHVIECAILTLRHGYDAEIAQVLRSLGLFRVKYEEQDPVKYQKELDRAFDLATSKVVKLKETMAELERFQKTKEGKALSEDEWNSSVAMLSKHQGYYIDTEKITVYKYLMIYNNFTAEYEARKKQKEAA